MSVKVTGAHFVAQWMWDCKGDTCGICRQAYEMCCPNCHLPGDDCPIVTGQCTHTFHIHCFEQWSAREPGTNETLCPMCRQPWQY